MGKKNGSGRITLVDVAKDAGVSRATASLVVRNSDLVADSTRQKVLASIEKLGYVYNRGAAMMRTQQSYSIGVVVLDISNPFFAELTLGAESQLEGNGYVALLANTSDTASKQSRLLETVLEHGVDGVLICPAKDTDPDEIQQVSRQTPIVQFVRSLPELELDYVGFDHQLGTELATQHLIEHGHQRIAYLGGPLKSSARQERIEGYMTAHEKAGLSVDEQLIVASSVSTEGGVSAIQHGLSLSDPPTAAVCYNDVMAFGVMLGLQAAGINPGDDFSVVGFDNIAAANTWYPALTTVSGDPVQIGEVAVNRLLERIKNPDLAPARIILPPDLIIRASCGDHA